ncbi:MAG: DUF2156 domain-containing protein [Victivallales bacterium]|nr:DUF2156 domain-containing protein [Victivallales bacterium]
MEWFRQQIGDFHPLALADVPQLARFLRASKERSCEFSVANLYLWSFSYHVRWLVDDNRLYLHTENREEPEDALMVVVPEKVPDPPAKELLAFSEEMRKQGHTGRFQQLRENFVLNCPELSQWFEIQPMDEEVAEYVYRLDNLATLAGERYSKKRNLVKQFARGFPAATSRPLDDSDLPAVLAMSEEWLDGHPERSSRHLQEELVALKHLQDAPLEYLGLVGQGIFLEGRLIAYEFCSPIAGGMWTEHFEKALKEFNGAAQALNQSAAQALQGRCEWLNREQDLGSPGLRQAKRSYHPEYLLRNYDLFPR